MLEEEIKDQEIPNPEGETRPALLVKTEKQFQKREDSDSCR
jgi:hypothetical protein